MRIAALVFALGLLGCGKSSTCEQAATRMLDCKLIVGGLFPKMGEQLFVSKQERSQVRSQLVGACDSAVASSPDQEKRMKCVAEADSCEALAACE
jgi:hypothetical protein